jgi:hypothetical protein
LEITKKQYTTQTTAKIKELHNKYKFKSIGVDDGGLGFGVFSELLNDYKINNKIKALNNSRRSLDDEGKAKKRLMKEEMYFNLLSLMENNKLLLLNDDELKASLMSIQFELVKEEGKPVKTKIWGDYSHIVEGLIRACWLASEDKSLNIWAF